MAGLRAIYLPMLRDDLAKVQMKIRNLTKGVELKTSTFKNREFGPKTWTPNNEAGDRIRIELVWKPAKHPSILRTEHPPKIEMHRSATGQVELDFVPIFLAQFDWPTQHLVWLWIAVLGVFAAALRRRESWISQIFWGLLVAAAAITSLLFWQQSYSVLSASIDPDGYQKYGTALRDYILQPGERERLAGWMHESYAHTYVALVPVVLALLGLLGLPMQLAYIFVVALSSLGTLALVLRIGRDAFGLNFRILLGAGLLFATHLAVLKSFARPSTDMPGVFAVTAMLAMLLWRLREVDRRQLWLAPLLGIALALVRPPGPAYVVFFGFAWVVIDWLREKRLRLPVRLGTGFIVAGIPGIVFLALYALCGWESNLALAMKKKEEFESISTLTEFLICLPALLQFLPLAWFAIRAKDGFERRAIVLLAAWAVFFGLLLTATKAPFMVRLLLPVLPALALLTMLGMRRLDERAPRLLYPAIGAIAAVNVAIAVYLIFLPVTPPMPWGRFIY